MHLLFSVALLSSLLLVSADKNKTDGKIETIEYDRNFTISFFPDDKKADCTNNDASKSITFTTNTLSAPPETCFNITDIFSEDNNSTGVVHSHWAEYPDSGTHYLLGNKDAYDPHANYSRVWFKQVNTTAEPGEWSPWYWEPFSDHKCGQEKEGEYSGNLYPYMASSCQTETSGRCETVPFSIQSFKLRANWEQPVDACWDWTGPNQSARAGFHMSGLVMVATGLAVFLIS